MKPCDAIGLSTTSSNSELILFRVNPFGYEGKNHDISAFWIDKVVEDVAKTFGVDTLHSFPII